MSKVLVSRKWKPGEPMNVRWSRRGYGRIVGRIAANTPIPSTAIPGPPFNHFGPGGLEYPMLERPYDLEEILSKRLKNG